MYDEKGVAMPSGTGMPRAAPASAGAAPTFLGAPTPAAAGSMSTPTPNSSSSDIYETSGEVSAAVPGETASSGVASGEAAASGGTVPGGAAVAGAEGGDARPAVVWLAGADGDESFARSLGLRLAREPGLAELELMYGSWDPPGARLLDAVAVMDQLVSPGGDPWKRQQNHQTLATYLLEEAYEAYDTIEAGDTEALREELGDVLLQILLHARLAEEHPEDERWSIDDVAGGFVEKMIRRNPHVFAGEAVADIEEITANWERIKKAEKSRQSVLDGVALSQPALALTAKILSRTRRAGLDVPLPTGDDVGSRLLRLVAESPDAEHLLRQAALAYADAVRSQENVRPSE
ncbi:MazG family protein [Actinoplanes sp. CA-054009]